MRITTPYGTLLVDEQTRIPLTITNPMFSNEGSHSLPFTVPWCEHNLAALGHPERVHSGKKSLTIIPNCTINAQPISETGTLEVVDCVTNSPIELAFITREGSFNSWANSTKLKDLDFPEGLYMSNGYIAPYIVAANANLPYPNSYFAMFPVIVEDNGDYDYLGFTKPTAAYHNNYNKPYNFPLILNNWEYPYSSNTEGKFVLWERLRQDLVSFKLISPFLYVNALIDFIFTTANLRVKTNELTTIPELNRLCVLNNSEYVLYNNKFNWDAMVPDMSVMEFLTAIENKFNCTRFVDMGKREVEILFNDTLIEAKPTTTANGVCVKKSSSHKEISISHDTVSDDFIKESAFKLADITGYLDMSLTTQRNPPLDANDEENIGFTNDNNTTENVVFFPASQFICLSKLLQNNTGEQTEFDYVLKRIKVGCQSHQKNKSGDNVIDFKSKAAIAAMISTQVPAYVWRQGDYPSSNYIRFNNGLLFCQRFMVGLNSINNKFNEDGSIADNEPGDFPLTLSIYRGKLNEKYVDSSPPSDYPLPGTGKQPYGSPFPYDRLGYLLSESEEPDVYPDTLSLQVEGENGLYENFFKATESFYNNAGLPCLISHFDKNQIAKHNLRHKVVVDNVSVFLTKVSYTVSINGVSVDTVEALTAKPLLDS